MQSQCNKFLLILHRKPKNDKTMNYIKTLALLISLSTLASCTQGYDDFPEDVYSINEIKDTKSSEPTDTTATGRISIHIDEPDYEDIDYTVSIP